MLAAVDENLIPTTRRAKGGGVEVASWLAAGPIGYVALGRDKTKKTKAKGTLVLTDKAIYCAGNVYPYDTFLCGVVF